MTDLVIILPSLNPDSRFSKVVNDLLAAGFKTIVIVDDGSRDDEQHFFNEGEYLRYEENYKRLKTSPNYRTLNSNMAQQILKEVDGSFRSFFGLL